MDKYEYKQLSERMIELMQNEEYGEAKEIADSIDWRRVRNIKQLQLYMYYCIVSVS